jgi:hypothetical protein
VRKLIRSCVQFSVSDLLFFENDSDRLGRASNLSLKQLVNTLSVRGDNPAFIEIERESSCWSHRIVSGRWQDRDKPEQVAVCFSD